MSDVVARLNAILEDRYHIERQLGEGGMANVYLADDLKHGRKVALKVLKPELAAVVGAARFLAEIKTTAGLQHPHILPLFDSGEADGVLYYVMPHVEDESLKERLDREHQLPVNEAVRIGIRVLEALDYAHRQGVIHRDIKPANILLQDGAPVISDFGIALAVSAGAEGRLTETGLSLGTPHYMSPEQATGDLHVGVATDVYALGCVLSEMLVGEPPYTGATPQAILGKIIAGEPASASRQRPSAPPNVDAAINKALERIPADRFTSAQAFAEALGDPAFRWPAESPDPAGHVHGVPTGIAVASFIALAALAFWGWLGRREPVPEGTPVRAVIPLGEGHVLAMAGGTRYPVAISSDGRRIVYVGQQGTDTRLYLRNLSESTVRAIRGTEGARLPFFSPDGDHVGFFSGTEIQRVSLAGGIPTPIAEIPPFNQPRVSWSGATWARTGTILYSLGESLWQVSAEGLDSPEEVALTLDPHRDVAGLGAGSDVPTPIKWPRFLPGGELALVSVGWEDQVGVAGVVELRSGRFTPLTLGGLSHYSSATGHLILEGAEERVSIVQFDLDRLLVTGNAQPVLEGIARGPAGGATIFAVSEETGTLIFARGGFERSIVLVDRNGRPDSVAVVPRGYRFPTLSADGCTLAVTVDPRPSQIWIVDVCRETGAPLTTEGYHLGPTFSRDGSRLAFGANPGIAWTPWPLRDSLRRLTLPMGERHWIGNEALVGVVTQPATGRDLFRLNVRTGDTTSVLTMPGDQFSPSVSPDMQWLAFVGDHTGVEQVYVTDINGGGIPVPVSRGGGADPRWSYHGDEIFYRTERWIVSVPVRTAPRFEVLGPPDSSTSSGIGTSTRMVGS